MSVDEGLKKMVDNNITTSFSFNFTYANLPIIVISVFGITSNILLLIAFLKDPLKCFRNSGTYLVMNLSIADCLTSLSSSILERMGLFSLPLISEFVILLFGFASVLSLISISVDQALFNGDNSNKTSCFDEKKVMIFWVSAIWILDLVILTCIYLFRRNEITYITSAIVVVFSIVMYALTYSKLKKQSSNIVLQNSREGHAQEIRILKEQKFLKTIIIVACVAFACLVPSLLFLQISESLGLKYHDRAYAISFRIFAFAFYANFALNPLIDFRSAYVTQFSINSNQDYFSHMLPRLHCNSLFDTGVT